MAASPDIAASLSPIEFDSESRSVRATHDSARDSTSLAVVSLVATALDRAPLDLTPIHSVIETDALDKLFTEGSTERGNSDSTSFRYEGFDVTVTREGVIEAVPIETT